MKRVLNDALISQEDNRGYRILNEALGKIAFILLEDDVVEVYCNSTDPFVWIEYAGKGRTRSDIIMSSEDRRKVIQTVATFSNTIAKIPKTHAAGIIQTRAILIPSITSNFSTNNTANIKMKYVFKSDTVLASGLAKSFGSAERERDVAMVVPENFMIVFWLSSRCFTVSCTNLDSGITCVRTVKEKTIKNTIANIFTNFSFRIACLLSSA